MSNGGVLSHFDPKHNNADLIGQFQRTLTQSLEVVHEEIDQLASAQSRSKSVRGKTLLHEEYDSNSDEEIVV